MAQFTSTERDAIENEPLELDDIRDALRRPDQHDDPPDDPQLLKGTMDKLLTIMISGDACEVLASRTHQRTTITSELRSLRTGIRKATIDDHVFRPLSLLVTQKASDVDVWAAVIALTVSHSTPPTSPPLPFGNPVSRSSVSLQGLDQTRSNVENHVFHEIRPCTYRAVGGFHEKYFVGRKWNIQAEQVWKTVTARSLVKDEKWALYPVAANEANVCKWWLDMQNQLLSDQRAVYYQRSLRNRIGREAARQIELFVKKRDAPADTHELKNLLVVGELRESEQRHDESLLLQVASTVRDVFAAQPTRQFVHAFTLSGPEIETWVFDRSGPYSGAAFNIHEEPEKIMQVMCGYLMMSDEELGLDTLTKKNDSSWVISIPLEGTDSMQELELDPRPLSFQRAIVCRGTSCFRAKVKGTAKYDRVLKYSWTSSLRPPEADFLRKANERGVEGLGKLVGYREITSINKLRQGLSFPSPHEFRDRLSNVYYPSFASLLQSRPTTQSTSRQGKRKLTDSPCSSKRPRLCDESVEAGDGPLEDNVIDTLQGRQGTSLTLRDDKMAYDDRILRVLVIYPAGRSITKFKSGVELLGALRDAITVHQSLYLDGKILHRDISANNIIIVDPKETGDGFRGKLIDLDVAEDSSQAASSTQGRTGTIQFMAIEVLRGVSHTYRHDLESFFYVLIWLCACRGKATTPTILQWWFTGSCDDISDHKVGHMHINGIERILREIPEELDYVKPLCRDLRGILFKRGLFIGTPSSDPRQLYGRIIGAFDETLGKLEKQGK